MTLFELRRRPGRAAAVLTALGALLAGCGSLSTPSPTLSSFFNSVKPGTAPTAQVPGEPEFECPGVTIRQGAATYAVSANPKEPTAMNLRYQVGIGDTARECRLNAGVLTMRVGIEGRVVLGPAGTPGTLEVPLRFAVVQESTEPKTIVTKLQRVPVAIPENQANVAFTHIEDGLTFPMPRGNLIDAYVVYVGFDPLGATQEKKRPAPKRELKLRRTS